MALLKEQTSPPAMSATGSPHPQPPADTTHRVSNASQEDFYVVLLPCFYRLWWILIAIVHITCAGKFGFECLVYWHIPQIQVATVFEIYNIVMPLSDLYVLSMVHGAIAAAHGLLVLQMALGSIRARQLAFFIPIPFNGTIRSSKTTPSHLDRPPAESIAWLKLIRRLYARVFGRRGLLGYEGKYFAYVYIAREIFETVLQSVQAYHMSQLVPHVAINRFFVLIIALNCWATPVIQHWFLRNPPLERLLCLLFDVMLDFVSTVGIPTRLAVPYLMQFKFKYNDFPYALWYDDIWLVNMIHELQLVFISSWAELVCQIVFSASLIMSMQAVKRLIRPSSSRVNIETGHFKRLSVRQSAVWATVTPSMKTSSQSGKLASMSNEVMARISSFIPTPATSKRLKNGLHAVLALWGLLILVLHVRVSFGSVPLHCIVMARPWFGTKSGCALMYVNCKTVEGATGNLQELSTAMDGMDEATLTHFVVRHCPHVEIPSQLQRFPHLIGMKLYNSTLVSWDADAALTGMHHPKISFLFIIDVNMTEFPLGLQSNDFPRRQLDIEFCGTNLSELPDDLHQKWPSQSYLCLERSAFTSVPETLTHMALPYLSMTQNQITALPTALLTSPSLQSLRLFGNPIEILPAELSPSAAMKWLDVSFSQLHALPKWMDPIFFEHFTLIAVGTPLCKEVLANISADSLLARAYQNDQLVCQATDLMSSNYPYQLEPLLDSKYS